MKELKARLVPLLFFVVTATSSIIANVEDSQAELRTVDSAISKEATLKDALNDAYATSTDKQESESQILESTPVATPSVIDQPTEDVIDSEQSVEDILKNASDEVTATPAASNDEEAKRLQALKNQALELFKNLDLILEDLALRIENNQIILADKRASIATIRIFREVIQKVLSNLYQKQMITVTDAKEIEEIILFWEKLHSEIVYLVEHKFEKLKDNAASDRTRTPTLSSLSVDELEKLFVSVEQKSAKLKRTADHLGRNILNRTFVATEHFWKKHKIGNKVLYSGLGLLAATWLWYRLDERLIEKIIRMKVDVDLGALPKETYEQLMELQGLGTEEATMLLNRIVADHGIYTAPNWLSNGLWKLKRWIGSRAWGAGKASGLEFTPRSQIGWVTELDNLLGNSLGLCTLGVGPAIPIVSEYVFPALKESAMIHWNSFLSWLDVVASFLRGGPIKRARDRWEKELNNTLDDLIGHETARKEFQAIIDYMLNYEQYDRLNVAPTKGIMLTGETRTGKTFAVKCFAGSLKRELEKAGKEELRYFSFTAADIAKWGVKTVFSYVSYYSPAVLFIDEFDTSGAQRDRNNTALCEYLEVLSDLNEKSDKKVIVIVATNNPNNIDRALRAIGRLGKHIPFSLPNLDERREFLRRELVEKRAVVIDDSVIEKLARETTDANYDGLTITVQKALLKAKIENTILQPRHLEEAVNEEVHKILTEVPALDPNRARLVATHIASQAFIRILLKGNSLPGKITICPVNGEVIEQSVWQNNTIAKAEVKNGGIDYGNIFLMESTEGKSIIDEAEMRREIRILLAGHIGESIILNSSSIGYHTENQQKAFELAKMITFKGLKPSDFSEDELHKRLDQAHELMAQAEADVRTLFNEYKDALIALAISLMEEKTLDIRAILEIICEVDPKIKTFLGFDELKEEIESAVEPELTPANA